MRTRKLVHLLARLSLAERKEFAEFLRSPLHAHRPRLAELVELIDRLLVQDPAAELTPEDFYACYNPGQPYDGNNLNRLISVTTGELRNYLAFTVYREDKGAQVGNAIRAMGERRWDDVFPSEVELARKKLKEEVAEDEHRYYQEMRVEREMATYVIDHMPKNPGPIYQRILDAVDRMYLIVRLRTNFARRFHDARHNTRHLERWDDVLENKYRLDEEPGVIQLFTNGFRASDPGAPENEFHQFKELLSRYIPHYPNRTTHSETWNISKDDAIFFYSMALNYCAYKTKTVGHSWSKPYRLIWDEYVGKGIALEDGILESRAFTNYIRMQCVAKETKYARDFYNRYIGIIEKKDFDLFKCYGEGLILYWEGNYTDSQKVLLNAKNHFTPDCDLTANIGTRVLICLNWYELGDVDGMAYEAHAMRTFLTRDEHLAREAKLSYVRFCREILSLERILKGPVDQRKQKFEKLFAKILNGPRFHSIDMIQFIIQREVNGRGAKPKT